MAQRSLAQAIKEAHAADAAWSDELRRVFGPNACEARYRLEGRSTPELQRLNDAKLAADDEMRAAFDRSRSTS